MKTEWDYSEVAKSYLDRPEYSSAAIDALCEIASLSEFSRICDVGAGVAHLTLQMAQKNVGKNSGIVAIEPNDEMRKLGIDRTRKIEFIKWYEGTAEKTDQEKSQFDIVTFGSSFNVTDRVLAIKEAKKIAKKNGWFACMWNHRDLDDPHQKEIEKIIKDSISDYDYGSRRENQHEFLRGSNVFESVLTLEGDALHSQTIQSCITAWRSHVTLKRQSGERFNLIIEKISDYLNSLSEKSIKVPYKTRVYMGKFKA